MLLTLVIVELGLCTPGISIKLFPNFRIIGVEFFPFRRIGGCNGVLQNVTNNFNPTHNKSIKYSHFSVFILIIYLSNFICQIVLSVSVTLSDDKTFNKITKLQIFICTIYEYVFVHGLRNRFSLQIKLYVRQEN